MKKLRFRFLGIALSTAMMIALPFNIDAKPINELEQEQQTLQGELDSLKSQLVNLLAEIGSLETQIAENEAQIAETEEELEQAILAEQRQYSDMQLRMQYMYENGDQDMLAILLESKSFSDFLNKIEYANAVYAYDRLLLDSYEATRVEIEGIKADLEDQKVNLANQQEQLSATKSTLNALIESKQNEVADINQQLEAARAEAARIAAQRAAEAQAQRQQANAQSANASVPQSAPSGGNPKPSTGVGGNSVTAYANQFVGNPYVWGGNSLTNGVDCSGFVVQVYSNFGIDLSGSRSSEALRYVGQPVSYENMKAGDIVCYSGHVAIYNGDGTIVEAMNTANGITSYRPVNYKPILAIRRVV